MDDRGAAADRRMPHRTFTLCCLFVAVALSGCFIEPGQGTSITYDGNFSISDEGFEMEGSVVMGGGIPSQDEYENITVEFYTYNGSQIHKEKLGSLTDKSDRLHVSVALSEVPHYVIIDSSDIWDGKTGVEYYTRSEAAQGGYAYHKTADREELPITPEG